MPPKGSFARAPTPQAKRHSLKRQWIWWTRTLLTMETSSMIKSSMSSKSVFKASMSSPSSGINSPDVSLTLARRNKSVSVRAPRPTLLAATPV